MYILRSSTQNKPRMIFSGGIGMKSKQLLTAALAALMLAAPAIPVQAEAGKPIAENMEIETYRGVSVGGQLRATDPQGDDLSYQITTPPIKGEVVLNDDGSFVYTPDEGRRGKDYFGYTATDHIGNVSQEATVIITLRKQKTNVTYADMTDSPYEYDALCLVEEGVFVGTMVGGDYVFSPDTMISRGEFLAMCMTLSDLDILSAVSSTGYTDDSDIPQWQKPYIATALMHGSIGSINETGSTDFEATAPITCAQAAVMLDGIFGLSGVSAAVLHSNTPDWAAQAVSNLTACRVLPENCDPAQYLNRGMTADMLCEVMDIMHTR